jgi:putative spermidine/putrescine transport system ATP-binding protein
MTFVHVTHSQEEAMALADLVVVMNQGRIEQAGTARDVFERPRTAFIARFIGAHNVVDTPSGAVAVRSDRTWLAPAGGPGLPVSVRAVEYQGSHVQVHLAHGAEHKETADESPDSQGWVALVPDAQFHASPLEPGQRVAMSWHEADAHVLQG